MGFWSQNDCFVTYKVKNVHVEVGKVVKNGQNLVYVVFEWPLSLKYIPVVP